MSSCTSSSFLSNDPQTAEDILKASTEHGASITLMNGKTIDCFSVAVRKDSTQWSLTKLGSEFSVPTDSIYAINVSNPQIAGGIVLGVLGGAVLGGIIGGATNTSPPRSANFFEEVDNTGTPVLSVIGGAFIGGILGGIAGGAIGSTNGMVWTRGGGGTGLSQHGPRWVPIRGQWVYIPSDTLHSLDTTKANLAH